ncbi:MAG: AraC family transcriptional regulator [Acidobacteriota bacterium]|nr:AraC family transcriptional regulator [Acidobacteriota bacterium]
MSAEVGDFTLTETLHLSNMILPRHDHESANINFVLQGSLRETTGKRPQDCQPHSLLVKPAGAAHSDKYGEAGARCLIIEIKPQRLERINRFSKLFDDVSHFSGGVLSALAWQIYKEFLCMDVTSPLIIEGLVLEMLGHAERRNLKAVATWPPQWLQKAREIMHEHFSERLSLTDLAASVEVHPAHLAKMFRRHFKCTVGAYVRRLRMDYAASELARSNASLSEIALASGFFDQSHFANTFKKYMKMTPAEYRLTFGESKADAKRLLFSKTS